MNLTGENFSILRDFGVGDGVALPLSLSRFLCFDFGEGVPEGERSTLLDRFGVGEGVMLFRDWSNFRSFVLGVGEGVAASLFRLVPLLFGCSKSKLL